MKNEIENWIYKSINKSSLTLVLLFVWLLGYSQAKVAPNDPIESVKPIENWHKVPRVDINQHETTGKEKYFEVKAPIDFRPNIILDINNTKAQILPARDNQIVVQVSYIAEAENEEILKLLEDAMITNLLNQNKNEIKIGLDFYTSMNTTITPVKWKTNIKLKNGKKIKVSQFQIKELKIFMPADADLNLDTKYSEVDIDFSLNGKLKINSYDCQIQAKAISDYFELNGKYSKFKFSRIPKAKLDLYESNFKAIEIDHLSVDSKYSKININNIKTLRLESYEGNFHSLKTETASISSKYCDINITNLSELKLNAYEGSFTSSKTLLAYVNSKYLDATFDFISRLSIVEGYENDFEIQLVDSLSSKLGKYNDFNISKLNSNVQIDGYEYDLSIAKVANTFTQIWATGKYVDVKINMPANVAYKIYGNIQYPDLNLNRKDYKVKLHEDENSSLKFEYYKSNEKTLKEIKLEGYQIDLKLEHY